MSLFSRLTEKSWQDPGVGGIADPADYRPAATTVGLLVYFAVIAVIFSIMAAAYFMRMGMQGAMAHGGGGDWHPLPEPPLLWLNTIILIVSSVAWEAARRAARQGARARMRQMTVAGGMLGLAFLAGQLLLWRQYQASGYYLAANPANAFFYMLTAVHGVHLAGGLVACARTLGQIGEHTDEVRVVRNIGLCAIYWHFLLLIWLLLAGLLILT